MKCLAFVLLGFRKNGANELPRVSNGVNIRQLGLGGYVTD